MNLSLSIVSEKDKKAVYLLSSLVFVIFTTIIVGENIVESLLISNLGASILPKIFIINAFVLFFISLVFLSIVDRVERGKLFANTTLLFCSILIGARLLIHFNVLWIYPVLYIISYTMKTVLFIIFWTTANDICDAREAKNTFPIIAGAGILGNTFASVVTVVMVKNVHTINLIFVWIILLIISIAVYRRVQRNFPNELKVAEFIGEIKKRPQEFVQDIQLAYREPIIKLISLISFILFLFLFNIDFQFYKVAGLKYGQVDELTGFLGIFKGSYSMITFLLHFFVVSSIFNRLGIAHSMMIVPVIFIGIFIHLFWAKTHTIHESDFFMPMVVATFIRFVIFETIFSPTYQIIFSALRKKLRGKGKAFIEGLIKPVSICCAGLFILFFVPLLGAYIYLLLLAAAGILFYATYILKNWYTETLFTSIGGTHYHDFIIAIDSFSSRLDEDSLPYLQESLNREEDITVKLFILEMMSEIKSQKTTSMLKNIYHQNNNVQIRAGVVSALAKLSNKEDLPFLMDCLAEKDDRIKANAIEAISKLDIVDVHRIIEPYMIEDLSPRVRANTTISLWNAYRNDNQKQSVIDHLKLMLESVNPLEVSRALFILGEIKHPAYITMIAEKINTDDARIRNSALQALANIDAPLARKILVYSLFDLNDISELNTISFLLVKCGTSIIPIIMDVIQNKKTTQKRVMLTYMGTLRRLEKERKSTAREEVVNFAHREILLRKAMDEIFFIYKYYFILFAIKEMQQEHISFLQDVITEKIDIATSIVLEIVSILDQSDKISSIFQKIRDADEHVKADAFEIIEQIGKPEIIEPLLPILERENISKIMQVGEQVYNLQINDYKITIPGLLANEDLWIQAVTIHTVGMARELSEDNAIIKIIKDKTNSEVIIIRELAQHALRQKSKTIIKSISTKGERSMLDKDMLKEKFSIVERVIFFRRIPFFKSVDSEQLKLFAEIANENIYAKGDIIVQENTIGENLFIIKSGSVRQIKGHGKNNIHIATLDSLNTFGELRLFDNDPYSSTFIAGEESSILVLRKDDVVEILNRSPEISLEFLKVFSKRLLKSGEEIKNLKINLEQKDN